MFGRGGKRERVCNLSRNQQKAATVVENAKIKVSGKGAHPPADQREHQLARPPLGQLRGAPPRGDDPRSGALPQAVLRGATSRLESSAACFLLQKVTEMTVMMTMMVIRR